MKYCYYCPDKCRTCEGSSYDPKCTECYEGYKLSGGKCLKDCAIGNNNLCKSCNSEEGKIDRCLECNDGDYLLIIIIIKINVQNVQIIARNVKVQIIII